MDGELVMCSVENNNNNKITRKQQQNIKTMCIPQTSNKVYFNICECFMHNITII